MRLSGIRYVSSQPWPFPASLMVGCRGVAASREITVDPVELEAAEWVSRERMLDIFAGLDDTMKPARKGSIANFLLTHWLADSLE